MTYDIAGRSITLSKPDKILFPDEGLTKKDLADYMKFVAPVMMRHVEGRPVSVQRFPDGISEDGFFQKNTPEYFPEWIRRERLEKEDGHVDYTVVEEEATLVYLADQACITLHTGLSPVDHIRKPDRLVFDLDPPGKGSSSREPGGDSFSAVQSAARIVRQGLESCGMTSFVMTTGSSGLHVVVPLDGSAGFDGVRSFARTLSDRLAEEHANEVTVEQRKAKREGRVYLDVMRNAYGQTSVCPYSVRARPGAPIATPLDWDEALASEMRPDRYTLTNIRRRLGQKDDPWMDFHRHRHALGAAVDQLNDS